MTELVQIACLGGALALDATTVGQFMLSRPLVAGTLTGALLGDPEAGLLIGALLELYLLVSFPSGGARFPEGATATVVAVAAASASSSVGAIPVAIAVGLLWGHIGDVSITQMRKVNGRLAPESSEGDVRAATVTAVHLAGVLFDFIRGSLVTGVGAFLGRGAVIAVADVWPLPLGPSVGLVLAGASVSAGILLHDLGGFGERRVLFVAGLALGIVGARFL